MRASIHRHLSYANVMATIAVFVALGGSTFAASYVITKSSQIKNGAVTGSDVKNSSLTGGDIQDGSLTAGDFSGAAQGPVGPQGSQGSQGPHGPQGLQGDRGPQGDPGLLVSPLPSGETLRGVYGVQASAGSDQDAVTFQIPLATKPQAAFIPLGNTPPQACDGGTIQEPRADPGWLCVWERDTWNRGYTLLTDESGLVNKGGKFGFIMFASTNQPTMGGMQSVGTWAVTAQ